MVFKNFSFARNEKDYKGEINSGEILVDTSGYISKERRIKIILETGRNMELFRRKGSYDVPEGVEPPDDLEIHPMRQKGFDLSDASSIMGSLKDKYKNALKKQAEQKESLKEPTKGPKDEVSDKSKE